MKSKLIFIVFCLFMFVCTSKAETVDKTAPIINSITPMTTEFRGGEKIGFKVNASDDISGIFEILLTFAQVDAPTVEGTEYTFMIGLSKKGPISNANDGLNDFINGEKIYYTKGDANKDPDGYPIERKSILGIYKTSIKYIGFPSVALGELINK